MRIHEDEKALEGLLQESPALNYVRSLPGMGPILAAVVVSEIDGIERFPSAQKLCGYAGLCPSTHSSGGKTFQGKLLRHCNKWLRWAFVEARLGCHRLLGLLRGLLQTQASPWQEAQPRHPGHGASDGSNHLAALDAAPGLREPCSRPNTSEASLPSVLPAREAWPRKCNSKIRPISLEEDFPQPLQNNAGWSLSPKALMTHLLIGWRAGDLIVINGRGPARPAPQRSVVIPSSALQTHSA